jgi:predicted ArsR family transcriptional regulator
MANVDSILKSLAGKPGQIASELNSTSIELSNLAKQGKVVRAGSRQTNKRGRPPVEWALPESEYQTEAREKDLIEVQVPKVSSVPRLNKVTHEFLNKEEERQASYIEDSFDGKYGEREMADYKILAETYAEVTRKAEKRNNPNAGGLASFLPG